MKNELMNPTLLSQEYDEYSSESFPADFPTGSPLSGKENDLFYVQSLNIGDLDQISSQSKKIRKKRTAYQRIDDDIRIELWEAVRQRGESLKAAAKRLNINYSSAKSIFYTFRKEGRILKKNAFEKSIKACQFEMNTREMNQISDSSLIPFQSINGNNMPLLDLLPKTDFKEPFIPALNDNDPESPMHGLVENFNHLILHNQLPKENEISKMKIPSFPSSIKNVFSFNDIGPFRSPNNPKYNQKSVVSLAPVQNPINPLERLKQLDNFYMNYSNSPLSGGGANIANSCSNPGSRSICQNEFDSFTDMVNALQTRPTEDIKSEIYIPKPVRFNAIPLPHEKIEGSQNRTETTDWNGAFDNAAIDTFQTFIDARVLFSDACKKVSYLNNLVQIQKSGISLNESNKIVDK